MGKEKDKDIKTNAMRILDRQKIAYEVLTYDCPDFIDGVQVADIEGVPHEESYKTLVARGKSGGFHVFVIPIEEELDLKACARAAGEKSVELIHVREITSVTGYVRGGCSPLGMKKAYPVFVDRSAEDLPKIYVSGGRIGSTVRLAPADLLRACGGRYADLTMR